ncbi:YdcF family protein [Myxococcota bacterium]|nr:YdcF family protein [Myxococcota bacterium]
MLNSLQVLLALPAPQSAKPEPLPKSEHAIVIFGSPTHPDGSPKAPLLRRLQKALELSKEVPDSILMVTGGSVHSPAEGPAMKRWLIAEGVDAKRIVVEDAARFTVENAEFVAPMLKKAGVKNVTLVTERFHMVRSHYNLMRSLEHNGLERVMVCDDAAPDNLSGAKLLTRKAAEKTRLLRDAASMAARHGGGLRFDPTTVARRVDAYSRSRSEWTA